MLLSFLHRWALRPVRLLAAVAMLIASAPPAHGAGVAPQTGGAQETQVAVDTVIVDHTLLVVAGSTSSLQIAATPGRGRGPTIHCGWFRLVVGGPSMIDISQLARPEVGRTYLLWCWYAADRTNLPGHPVVAVYTGPGVPGEPADEDDVSQYALDHLDFVDPAVTTNPAAIQIVGVPSWLAVTSRLDYEPIHANAGPVWASVWPRFEAVEWDLGNGDTLVCRGLDDATTVWDSATASAGQTSPCTYTYVETLVGDSLHELTATVTWRVLRRTFRDPTWQPWRQFSLTTRQPIDVRELQAVIR